MKTTNLKSYYMQLSAMKAVFDNAAKDGRNIEESLVDEYENFVDRAGEENPDLLIDFYKPDYYSHTVRSSKYYKGSAVLAHVVQNLAILQSTTEDQVQAPVIKTNEFEFIKDAAIKKILKRDYAEIQRGLISGNWKSVIIVSGGSIEAVLLDLLTANVKKVKSSPKAPVKTDINSWDLNDLIEVGVDTGLVDESVGKLSHTIREYRNLVHPGKELKEKLAVEPEEAKIAVEVLNIIIRQQTDST